jgi:hypothetical protein
MNMSNVLFLNQPTQGVGLPSYTYTIPAASTAYPFGGAGLYNVKVKVSVTNSIVGIGAGSGLSQPPQTVSGSGLSYVVNQNGAPVFTWSFVTPSQIAEQSKTALNCAISDVITIVFSSSTPIDEQLNSVKSIVSIEQGI